MCSVEIKQVVKRYDNFVSIDHVSLRIAEGEVFGLLGPNGAGKSTLIKMLSGLLPIDQGEIWVDGLQVSKHTLDVKRRIGLVPQELAIYEDLTAGENIAFFARLYGLRGKLLKERVEESLEFVGLLDRRHDKPASFSGGMKRRLNIACAITHHPKLIIMDEPTVGIDPQSRNHILESVQVLNQRGSTIIYTSHYMEEVEAISTRVGIMDKGYLIATGTKEELRRQAATGETLIVEVDRLTSEAIEELRNHPRITALKAAGNVIEMAVKTAESVLQDVLFVLSRHQCVIRSINRLEPNLESLFLSITGRSLRDE
ncbi:ABC transporter ATP-binding protein [Paenibacillus turpanensis]|uniref:ABC transporter ATP-binding protein n=1 Tax=Paenibacillus turpanensis TaxID=2689078 RepID=UPI00140BE7B7|nr:ABC transporter ATP-binding protein [Paenibacillus turpanensis]